MTIETLLRPSIGARNGTTAKLRQDREFANEECRGKEQQACCFYCGLSRLQIADFRLRI